MISISDINIDFVKTKDGLVGFASLVVNDGLFLSSIAIHKKLNGDGYRITYPKKDKWDLFYPINTELGKKVEQAIFEKLKDVMKKVENDRYNRVDNSSE